VALVAVVAVLAGCATAADAWRSPRPGPTASGSLGPGFMPLDGTPSPEATVVPAPGSWEHIAPAAGYRVVLLASGDDEATTALVDAVTDWAAAVGADLRTVRAADADHLVDAIVEATDLRPDVVVSAGNDLVDPLATVTASNLHQQYLVVGAEVAEPTANVTAVDWTGASFRGEGLGVPSTYDEATFTAERCARAVRVGIAAVLAEQTGYVFWID
jgi:hypothetical protein